MSKPCVPRARHGGAIASAVAALFAASYASSLFANPVGAQVVSGNVKVNTPGPGQMNITQKTPSAIVNWNSFSIGSSEAVRIAQPSASSTLLNRVTGNDPSVIAGLLQANGKVFLINPSGVIFAPGSSVNVGSLVASALNISNADFLAGNYHFVGASPATVSNAGSLTAQPGGTIALLGATVSNTGTVSARLGTVALGAGGDITVDFAGDGLTTLKINQGAAGALLGNTGTLAADGGTVVMSAQTADALAGTVINQQGIVRAQSISEQNGHILLDGGTSGVTLVGGTLDATGGTGSTGGKIYVTGYDVALLDGARVDASGAAGGGTVRFGGGPGGADTDIRNANAIWMSPTASINADALVDGNGGNVVVFSETASRIYGTLSAKGGAQGGNGGLIETSGDYLDTTGATVDASAPKGVGGTWKIDPFELDIVSTLTGTAASGPTQTGPSSVMFGPDAGTSQLLNTTIQGELNGGTSVTVSTVNTPVSTNGLGDINVDAAINMSGTSAANLVLSASGSISIGSNITSTGGPLGIVLDANVGNTSSGNIISVHGPGSDSRVELFSNGGAITIGEKAGQPGTFDGAAVLISYADIDARVGGSASQPSGSITIHGQAPGALPLNASQGGLDAVGIFSSLIATSSGDIEVEGNQGSGIASPVGGVYISSAVIPEAGSPTPAINRSSLTTGSGAIRLYGIGSDPTGTAGYQVSGVAVDDGTTVQTTTGSIDIRGQLVGGRTVENTVGDQGVEIGNSANVNVADRGTISVVGSTNSESAGILLSSYLGGEVTGSPNLSPGPAGTLILRASNNGDANSLAVFGTIDATSSAGATLVMLPGVVNSDFSIGNSDATLINVNSDASGFSINAAALTLFPSFESVVIGSSTQTGLITVYPATTFPTAVTLEAEGAGSQGISLPSGVVAMSSGTLPLGYELTLASAGPVTQGGAIQAGDLVLSGPGKFTLTNAANATAQLSDEGAGSVTFVNSEPLTLTAANTTGFDTASGSLTSLGSLTTISLAGDLIVSTTAGDIDVSAPVTSTASGTTTLSLSAAGNVGVGAGFGSSSIGTAPGAGPLDVTLDANEGGTAANYTVQVSNATINTNGGTFTIGDTGTSAVDIEFANIATGGGAVNITGTNSDGDGVAIGYSLISTGMGDVTVHGTSTGGLRGGGAFGIDQYGSGIQTGGGSISLTGTGGIAGAAGTAFNYGVYMTGAYSPGADAVVAASATSPTLATGGNGTIGITGTTTGEFARGVNLVYGALTTAGGGVTVTGTANVSTSGTGVYLYDTLVSTGAGPVTATGTVNDAKASGPTDGYGVWTIGSSIMTTNGSVTLDGTMVGATNYAYGSYLDSGFSVTGTDGSATIQPAIQTGRGTISVTGNVPATNSKSVGVDLAGAAVASDSGAISLTGLTTSTATSPLTSSGVVLEGLLTEAGTEESGLVYTPSKVSTGTGVLSIYGSGSGSDVEGVFVANGSTITSNNGGAIDIRGAVTSPTPSTNGGNLQYDYGTLVYSGAITAKQPNSTILIAGSTNTSDAGLAFGSVPEPNTFEYTAGPVSVNAGLNGTVALRAANDDTATSFVDVGAGISSSGGTLAMMPASVNPTTFNFTALDGTRITLFGNSTAGLSIDLSTYPLFSGFSALVLGSSTQTGLITVSGVCPSAGACTSLTKPSLNLDLTLLNMGSGSEGIQLLYGISLGSNTLTLASAGAVTDPGGIQAAGLLLDGPGNFTLTDPQNDVGVLAMLNAGNVNFLNSTGFVIGSIVSHSFDATSNTATTIDATNSNLTGNLLAQAATGGIGLGGGTASAGGPTGGANTNLNSGGTVNLVMENGTNGFFTDKGTGSVSATDGWRIWANTWTGETRGSVQPDTAQPNFYGCVFGSGCSWGGTVPTTGDHYVYVQRPTVTVTADGPTARVVGALNPAFGYSVSGLINGDTAAGTLTGSVTTTATQASPVGQYPVTPNFLSSVGYVVDDVPSTLTVTPVPMRPMTSPPETTTLDQDLPLAVSGLQEFFSDDERTFVYENNLQGTNICVGSNQPLFTTTPPGDTQDLLAVEWKRVRSQPNLNSCMVMNGQHGCGDF